ncbi:MAG: hypothetical protein ACYS6K_17740 [Planctomycetota bacterium]|jgi:hypothetical protein
MSKRKISPRFSITMAIIAFIVAAIPAFGVVMKEDTIGRIIFASVWILVGVGWLGHLLIVKKSISRE